MAQIISAILLVGFAIFAFRLAILLILIAGLIFRTKETIFLICLFAAIAAFNANPIIGSAVVIVIIGIAIYRANKKPPEPDDFDETT